MTPFHEWGCGWLMRTKHLNLLFQGLSIDVLKQRGAQGGPSCCPARGFLSSLYLKNQESSLPPPNPRSLLRLLLGLMFGSLHSSGQSGIFRYDYVSLFCGDL